ncbi:MAG: class I SAM-dependent methyltransferase [Rhodoferax sp.]|nr:class I SAM-dependent methyltransferase [Rhodoferax sp.]
MKLLACVAHVDPSKLYFLERQLLSIKNIGISSNVFIITNVMGNEDIARISSHIPDQSIDFQVEIFNQDLKELESPWLLTWVHKSIMKNKFQDASFTHFLNIEDDMDFTKSNFQYWLSNREMLRAYNLFPSFLRIERQTDTGEWFWTDSMRGDAFDHAELPYLRISDDFWFINLPRPYQGMFLYDRELMQEHIDSDSFDLEKAVPNWKHAITHNGWPLGLTEQANYGISKNNLPQGIYSRNFLPFYPKFELFDPSCFVHHMPNKYVRMEHSDLGKVALSDLFKKNTSIQSSDSIQNIHAENDGKVSNKWSSYLPYYDWLFGDISSDRIRLLEIGVQNGGSLETWAKYFINAEFIVGCDINEKCSQLVFEDKRISVIIGNANSQDVYEKLGKLQKFDVIIDDGSHLSEDMLVSFVNYFPLLKPGGIYVVEDTHAVYWRRETKIGSNNAIKFFQVLSDVVNYQFWHGDSSIDEVLLPYFVSSVPAYLKEGWIDSVEFRNSIITIRKAKTADHAKVGSMNITGNSAEVDPEPLRVRNAQKLIR